MLARDIGKRRRSKHTGRGSAGSRGSSAGSSAGGLGDGATSSTREVGLGAGEEAGEAVGLALGVLLRVLGAAAALVALGSALVGGSSLGRVGASNALACGLAGHVAGGAVHDAADLGGQGGLGRRSRGDGGRLLGENAGSESEDGNGVLHVDG